MAEDIKLHFLWPRLRHDLRCLVRHQGPTTFADAIKIAQRIKGSSFEGSFSKNTTKLLDRSEAVPMETVVQIVQKNYRYVILKGVPNVLIATYVDM